MQHFIINDIADFEQLAKFSVGTVEHHDRVLLVDSGTGAVFLRPSIVGLEVTYSCSSAGVSDWAQQFTKENDTVLLVKGNLVSSDLAAEAAALPPMRTINNKR